MDYFYKTQKYKTRYLNAVGQPIIEPVSGDYEEYVYWKTRYLQLGGRERRRVWKAFKWGQKSCQTDALICDNRNVEGFIEKLRNHKCELKRLIVRNCFIDQSTINRIMSAAMKHARHLEELDLGDNRLGPDGANALANFLGSFMNLQRLYLDSNQLESRGLTGLAISLSHLVNLKELWLQNNRIDSLSYTFINNLARLVNLEEIRFDDNIISDQSIINLAPFLQRYQNLRIINLMRNPISDNAKRVLMRNVDKSKIRLSSNHRKVDNPNTQPVSINQPLLSNDTRGQTTTQVQRPRAATIS